MTTSVLYDVPGPATVRRHRAASAAAAVVLAALAAFVLYRLAQEGQFAARVWEPFAEPGTWRAIAQGLLSTIQVAVVAVALALVFGAVFAVARLSDRAWIRLPAAAVVEFFRAVPLLLLILFIFLGYGDRIGRFWSLVLGLVLYNGSVLAEIFRAGIASVPRGQAEAAYAIGLTKPQVMRLVLVPQAVRTMLPSLISQSVVALKDSALGFVIAYSELAKTAQEIYVYYGNPLAAGVVVASIYIALCYGLSKLAVALEARQRRVRGVQGPSAAEEGAPGPSSTQPAVDERI
ncbi:MAG: amino acid ABC transporter permease [Actinomycetota bacterium]|nr:amino acid ABC transporter permease [Actinomycetota bacterium]